jgi:hypothetical protein
VSRPKGSPVDRAFQAYVALDVSGRQLLAAMIAGYSRAAGEMDAPPKERKPRTPKAAETPLFADDRKL